MVKVSLTTSELPIKPEISLGMTTLLYSYSPLKAYCAYHTFSLVEYQADVNNLLQVLAKICFQLL